METLTSKNYWAFYLVVIAAISVAVDSTLSLSFLTFATLVCSGESTPISSPTPSPMESDLIITCELQCPWSTIDCPTDADCEVHCIGSNACWGTNIVWSTNGVNTLICDGEYACGLLNFPRPPVDENFEIFCDSEGECAYSTIYCPTDADCEVNCIGTGATGACVYANIVWSTNGQNTLNCDPEAACYGVDDPTPSPTESDLIITCDEAYDPDCVHGTLMCPTDADCEVHCIAFHACYGANIVWSTNGVNALICDGEWACGLLNFPRPPVDENLAIFCDSEAECTHSTIYCPTDAKCKVYCIASHACVDATIVWSTNGENTLNCAGEWACAGVNFPRPPVDEYFEIFCDSEGECALSTIYCPTDSDCEVNCDAAYACKDATIVWSTNGQNTLNCDPEAACDGVNDPPDP